MTKKVETIDERPMVKSPRPDEKAPSPKHVHHRIPEEGLEEEVDERDVSDTGGGVYRPRSRMQDPASDPYEPWRGAGPDDSAARGYAHGWANCLMTSGAVGLDFHTGGAKQLWGGHLRHHQDDMVGGTDIHDLMTAWSRLGYSLSNRTGTGWAGVKTCHAEYRGIMLQGIGNVPGVGTYTGAHGIFINPETRRTSAGVLQWLIDDPLVSGWQWANVDAIKTWCQRLNSSVQFAVTRIRRPA